jgi:NitT/TauT family transport system permease protein
MSDFAHALGYKLVSVALLLAAWSLITLTLGEQLFPGPIVTTRTLIDGFHSEQMLMHLGWTLTRVGLGLALAMLIGIPVGIVMGLSRRYEQVLDIWVMIGLTVPSLCYAIMGFIWFGLNEVATVFAIGITAAPAIAINIWEGVKSIDTKLVSMARTFEASRTEVLLRVMMPQVLPFIMAATRFGLGIVWKIAVLVELIGRPNGVGFKLFYWYQLADMKQVLAWTLLFTLVMLAIELGILQPAERRLFAWRPRVGH